MVLLDTLEGPSISATLGPANPVLDLLFNIWKELKRGSAQQGLKIHQINANDVFVKDINAFTRSFDLVDRGPHGTGSYDPKANHGNHPLQWPASP